MENLGEKKFCWRRRKREKAFPMWTYWHLECRHLLASKPQDWKIVKRFLLFLFRRWCFRETKKVLYLWDLCWIHSLVDHIGRGELDSGMSKHVTEIKRTHIVSLSLFVFYLSLLLIYSLLSFRLYRFIFSNQSQRLPFAHTDHSFHNTYPSGC